MLSEYYIIEYFIFFSHVKQVDEMIAEADANGDFLVDFDEAINAFDAPGTFMLETNPQSWKPIFFWKPILNLESSAGVSYPIQF